MKAGMRKRAVKLISAMSLLAAVGIAGVTAPAHAQRVSKLSGAQLSQICAKGAGLRTCDAYVSGVMDGAVWQQLYNRHLHDKGDPAFCVPAGQTMPQIRGVVNAWLSAHPEAGKEAAGRAVFRALHDNYACTASSAGVQGLGKRPH